MVDLDELRDLFTGTRAHNNSWATTPCYRVNLALEIARRVDARSEYQLREALYDTTPVELISETALEIIGLAATKWRAMRALEPKAV